MDAGAVAGITALVGLVLSIVGVTGIDAGMISSALNGLISIVTLGAAIYSVVSHRQKNATLGAVLGSTVRR